MSKTLIFIPYQDADNFLSDGILTREFAMLYLFWKAGYKNVINIKKPRTALDKKRYQIKASYFPMGTVEATVKQILMDSVTIQYSPILSVRQMMMRRGWWNYGYSKTVQLTKNVNGEEILVYSNNPYAEELLRDLSARGFRVYFDVMDNFAIHPSLNEHERKCALEGYKHIFRFADCISANSVQTCNYMERYTDKEILLVKNGVFENNEATCGLDIPQVKQIREKKKEYEKCVGYIGKLGLRLDADLIDEVSEKCPNILFVFVGSHLKGQVNSKLVQLFESRKNILHIDAVPSAYVYPILDEFDILSIPHSVGKNENGGDPLKLYQYLTRKKPIITTPILGVEEFKNVISIADRADVWVAFLGKEQAGGDIENAMSFSWQSRIRPVFNQLNL